MELVLNTFGAYLHKKGEIFELKAEVDGKEIKQEVSPKKVSSILISTKAQLTTDAIKLAVDNNIDIVFLDDFGDPYGRVWHPRFGSTAFIRRRQLELFEGDFGLEIVKELLTNKIEKNVEHLRDLKYKRESKSEKIEDYMIAMEKYISKIKDVKGNVNDIRGTLMGYEGNASKIYFEAINFLIPEGFKFDGRSSRPAKDFYNAMLNYAYGILYSKVERACVIAGLDPFVGIMHTDNYNKKSFVFDLIEPFRDIGNRAVFSLFSKKLVNKEYFDEIQGGLKLNKDGKKVLINSMNEEFARRIIYRGRKMSRIDSIQTECHRIANKLIQKEEGEILC